VESKNKIKENEWLRLLEEAIHEGVQIRANHRFKYKQKGLGTFLTAAKTSNKTELIKKIESLGVNFKLYSKKPEDYLEKYISQLSTQKKPNKQQFITRFNAYVLPKKELLKEQTVEKLNKLWEKRFNEKRKWTKPETDLDRIQFWKDFRYNGNINPEGKWFHYRKYMGKLYGWVYTRKRDEQKMSLIQEHFTKKELSELKREGF
jgi:hypothetical protein